MQLHGTAADGIGTVVLEPYVIETLRAAIRGTLLTPLDDQYDANRMVHNGMIDRRPALMVRCAGVADVRRCVEFSRERNLMLSIRGGGHSAAGFAVCDGGLMIDLSGMRLVRVDVAARTARAGAGATWGDFDHETQAFGLATTGGLARPTGVAGLTLGGGHGFLMRRFGLACDNLLSADVVTADGRTLTASGQENEDLFWALRGGGGNFGVVTSFEFRLHPLSQMLGGVLIYPFATAADVFRLYREITADAPEELGSYFVLATLPDGNRAAAILVGYSGDVSVGERIIRPWRTNLAPLLDQVGPIPYTALQSIVEGFNPRGMRNYWKSGYLRGLDGELIDTLVDAYATVPAPFTHIVIEHLGAAVARVGEADTACSHRAAPYNLLVVGMWSDPREDEAVIEWVRGVQAAAGPFATGGGYVNYLTGDEGAERVSAAYGVAKHGQLVALKRKYDPENRFRLNQNITP